ncbi:hypothetical protein M011DRAFT_478714 [Sporormia fimetaria CBS 119925]|uniref:Uncharacterized protein n=1 Tax=Sporormia fimetaria CBS 119925 TaxID=1340428 RepID=A0A6A6V8F0_9PLEO|nr:hypothetical protein M011DRAFT_478714 [Sporormia fimetaria CBS 119925]
MKFFAVVAALAAGAYAASTDTCTVVTVTETVTYGNTIPVTKTAAPSVPPYPTSDVHYPSVVPTGSGAPPVEHSPYPTGTGVYPAPPEFTGAASGLKVGGVLAGAGALAAMFL